VAPASNAARRAEAAVRGEVPFVLVLAALLALVGSIDPSRA